MGNDILHAIIAKIQGHVAETFVSGAELHEVGTLADPSLSGGRNLWQQLQGSVATPKGLHLNFLRLDTLDLPGLLSTDLDPLDIIQNLFGRPKAAIERLLAAKNPAQALAAGQEIVTDQWKDLLKAVGPFLGGQFGILVSFLTTWKNLLTDPAKAADAVQDALLHYFFTKTGYTTVDEIQIVAPVHLTDVDVQQLGQLKALFSERTAERYVRDLIRLIVEAAGDVRYNDLKSRYNTLHDLLSDEAKKKTFTEWFKGFSSVAESAVTTAVEEACLGAGPFQSNALLAASAGTFAGTAARKAAQHVFLSELTFLRQHS